VGKLIGNFPAARDLARIMRPRSRMTAKTMSQKTFCELLQTAESTVCRFATVQRKHRKALRLKDFTSFELETHE
jgi:hypothetical protein